MKLNSKTATKIKTQKAVDVVLGIKEIKNLFSNRSNGTGIPLPIIQNAEAQLKLNQPLVPGWELITSMVEEGIGRMKQLPKDLSLSEKASRLAQIAFSSYGLPEPIRLALAELTIRLPRRFVIHRLTPEAVQYVNQADMKSELVEAPILLRSPWILEASHPERESLFRDTVNLAGYPAAGKIVLIGFSRPNVIMVAVWGTKWQMEDPASEAMRNVQHKEFATVSYEWFEAAVNFVKLFATQLESTTSIIYTSGGENTRMKQSQRNRANSQSRSRVRWVYLNKKYKSMRNDNDDKSGRKESSDQQETDLIIDTVTVRRHTKLQVCGPGLSERKEIEVSSYKQKRNLKAGKQTVAVGVASKGIDVQVER